MKPRVVNLAATAAAIRPFLPQYLQEHGIDTSKNFKCLNPKHEDKKPSMTCRQFPASAFCFSCSSTVDIFMAAHYLEDKPASGPKWIDDNFLYLAKKYGVAVDLADLTQEEIYEYRTYKAYEQAAELIADPEFGDYTMVDEEIARRGWDKTKLSNWGVGTVNTEEFRERMRRAGFEPGFLQGIDLDKPSLFNNANLLFTVCDAEGRPVGFSAKNLKYKKDDSNSGPKYLNTSGTGLTCAIFKKGERLYGFNIAKEVPGQLYIFEGQADVITARHHGLMNCCCTMGTALTEHHVNLLKKYGVFNVTLVFDADEAGQLAAQKALDEKFSKEKDFRIKLCQLPAGQDPDDLLRNKGFDEFIRLKKWTAFEWRANKFLSEFGDEPSEDQRRDVAEKMIPIIVTERSHIRQEEMAKQVSKMTGYELSTIMSEIRRLRSEKEAEVQAKKRNAVESLLSQVRYNPDEAEVLVAQCQVALEDINKTVQASTESSSTLNAVLALKEADENKTGEFSGFFLAPDGLGGIGKFLDDDWKKDNLFYIGGGPQASKCQHFETLIPLATGEYKTIKEVVEQRISTVLGMNSSNRIIPMKISRWIDSGELECFEVKTENGISTKPSETHPYYTLDGWKQVKELKVGDRIAIARNYSCYDSLHSPISEEDAVILGALLSDGSLTSSFGFSNTDEELLFFFKEKVEKKWGKVDYRYESNTLYVTDPTQQGSRLKDWLRSYNLLGKDAHEKFIPDNIFKCGKKRLAKFLGMFWACDGWVAFNAREGNKCEVGLTLCNYKMLKQVRSLLLRFGIKTKITYEKVTNQSGKLFDAYSISIRDIENIKKFYNNIRIPLSYKQQSLKAIMDSGKDHIGAYGDNFPIKIWERIKKRIIERGFTFSSFLTLLGEDRNYFCYSKDKDRYKETAAWKPEHDQRDGSGITLLQLTPRKLRLIGYILQDQFLIDLAEGDVYFDKITEIKAIGKHHCYDLEILPGHNFIAEDVVVHNTTLCTQLAYEIANDSRNNAMCIYHTVDDAARFIIYKWVCQASNSLDLYLSHTSNPNYWNKQPGYNFVKSLREKAYQKIVQMVKDQLLVVKDSSDGASVAYAESVVRYYRELYPNKNLVLFIDNFHKLPDYGDINGHERIKKLSNHLKTLAVQNHITIISTVEYRKLQQGEKPSNVAIAESRSLGYDANVIIHLYNDLHNTSEDEAVLIHEDKNGNILPRIWVKFGKNKISGYEGREFLDLYPQAAQLKAVDLETAVQDQKTRIAFLKENSKNISF